MPLNSVQVVDDLAHDLCRRDRLCRRLGHQRHAGGQRRLQRRRRSRTCWPVPTRWPSVPAARCDVHGDGDAGREPRSVQQHRHRQRHLAGRHRRQRRVDTTAPMSIRTATAIRATTACRRRSRLRDARNRCGQDVSAGPTNNGDGTFTLTYTVTVENTGDVAAEQRAGRRRSGAPPLPAQRLCRRLGHQRHAGGQRRLRRRGRHEPAGRHRHAGDRCQRHGRCARSR